MKSILNEVTMGTTERADAHNPAVAEANEEIQKQVQETVILARATQVCVNLHVSDWVATQQEDPILKTVVKWISKWKVQDWKHLLGDDTNTEEGNYPSRVEEANTLSRNLLPSPHTHWQVGRCFAVCSPHGPSGSCHEWMSLRYWTPGSAVNAVLAT